MRCFILEEGTGKAVRLPHAKGFGRHYGWIPWEINREMEICVQEACWGVVRGSHPGQRRKGQLGGVTLGAVTAKASSHPSESSGAGMSLQRCPKLRQGTRVYTPALARPRKQAAVGKQSRQVPFPC